MKKAKLEKLDLNLYEEVLPNGLSVYIIPKTNVNGIYATLTTKFGSTTLEFTPANKKKMIKVPEGIAHFLEHKMFAQKDGKDPFTFYSERGSDSNANTSNYKTTYLFSGSDFYRENLDYLLDYVQSPYFTDENVESEKGIINQEISMYSDEPFWRIYEGLIYNAFNTHPIKYPIAGSIKSVKEVTKENLYDCYNTFYNPSNMFLVITGAVEPKETLNIINANQEKKDLKKLDDIKVKSYNEKDSVEKDLEKIKMDVEISKAGVAYKFNLGKLKNISIQKAKVYLNMLFDIKFGPTSILNEELKNSSLTSTGIEVSLINTDKHILAMFMIESNEYDKMIDMIEEEIKNLKIEEIDFERKKKVRKSSSIYNSDNIYSLNNKIVSNIINYGNVILDEYKYIDSFNMAELNYIIENLDFSNKTTYKVLKNLD